MSVQRMIQVASAEVGYRETGNNDTKYNRWLGKISGYPHGGFGYPWCHSFLSWCLEKSGNAGAGPRTAGCAVGVAWFRARGRYYSTPQVGDFVYYGTGGGTHVELVVGVTASTITTIGGNTSGSLGSTYYNGDGTYRKVVSRSSSRIHGYGRPTYSAGGGAGAEAGADVIGLKQGDKGEAVKGVQQLIVFAGQSVGKAGVDGDWGPDTSKGLLAVRRSMGSKEKSATKMTGWAYAQLMAAVARKQGGK
ncbi:MAG TPA: CHAP domain-containing protein [Nonomuraea sp.]|nr:CHAP domain-containing protein [Nonomuraea sp.]